MKKSRSREAVRNKVIPAAEDFVHTAADRVGPLAQSAADRVGPLAEAAAERIGAAADKLSPLAHSAATKIGPLAHSAADRVGPLAHSAAELVAPLAHTAADAVSPYAQQAADRITPLTSTVRERGAGVLHEAAERFGPSLDGAKERVGPAVDAARTKVSDDLLPKLSEALAAAAASPLAVEALSRGKATLAAATGELALPPEKPKRRWPKRLAIFAALGGLAYVVARKFLGSKDSEWQAARPTTPYVPPTSAPPASAAGAAAAAVPASDTAESVPTAEHETPGDDPQAGASAHTEYLEANGESEPDQPAEGGVDEAAEAYAEPNDAVLTGDVPADGALPSEPVGDDFATDEIPEAGAPADDEVTEDVAYGASDDVASAYVGSEDFAADDLTTGATEPPAVGDDVTAEDSPVVADLGAPGPDQSAGDPEAELVYVTESDSAAEPTDVGSAGATEPTGAGAASPARWSGEGVYVGSEPPEGFTIKGNERSMKYHLPESGGYARTIAEVWFDSEESAQAAGFVRAQR